MAGTTELRELDQVELPYLDIQGDRWGREPWAAVRDVRAAAGDTRLAKSDRGIEVLAYEDYVSVMGDRRLETLHTSHWEEQGAGPMTLDFVDNGHLLTFDPERHLKVRRIMVAAFRMSHIEEQRAWFAELANELVDRFVERGECDLVADFSHRYSIEILCRMIGVPAEDISRFEQATLDMALLNAFPLTPAVPRLETALKTIWDYSTEIVAKRRVEPQEDFVTGLIRAQESEGKLSEAEAIWGVANLLFAGHDTTRFQLGAGAKALIDTGAWEELAESPDLAPAAVEEAIRLFPVVLVTSRVVKTDDFVLNGVKVPRDTILRCNWMAFNRDPAKFEDPDRLDLRRDLSGRAPFGTGVHKCIGHALARADIETGLQVLTERLTDVRLDGEVEFKPYSGGMGGPTNLPVRFSAR
jgi:cytochrome P450